jgi:hypothetical protein
MRQINRRKHRYGWPMAGFARNNQTTVCFENPATSISGVAIASNSVPRCINALARTSCSLARSSPFCPCRYRNGSKRIGGKPYLEYRWPEHHVCVKIIAQDRRRKRGVADLIHRLRPSTILGEKCDIPLHGDMLIFHPPQGLDACVVCSVYGSWRLCEVLPMPFTSGGFGHAS